MLFGARALTGGERVRKICTLIFILFLAFPAAAGAAGRDALVQVSTIDALMTGVYDGETTLGALKEKGDFGIGTFNGLNGEMVLLDGVFYRITSTGAVERPGPETKTPFAAVTFFDADRTAALEKGTDFKQFTAKAESLLPTENIFYAIKITGTFEVVRARSVAAQTKPYRPLEEVVKTQALFEFTGVEGTIVGFRCPSYAKGINVPGYHLHFLSADRKAGGHVLDFKVLKAKVEIDDTSTLILMLPSDGEFYAADLKPDREKAIRAVEK
jgi:acetolactate decarboxylase